MFTFDQTFSVIDYNSVHFDIELSKCKRSYEAVKSMCNVTFEDGQVDQVQGYLALSSRPPQTSMAWCYACYKASVQFC